MEIQKIGQRAGAGLEAMKDSPPIRLLLSSAIAIHGPDAARLCGLEKLTVVELVNLAIAANDVFDQMKEQGRQEPRIFLTAQEVAGLPRPTLEDCKWDENLFVARLESWFKERKPGITKRNRARSE